MKTITREKVIKFCVDNMAVLFFLLLFCYNSIITPNFFSFTTIRNLINQSTSLILVALGATLIISSGCIDISLGSGFCWGAVVFGLIVQSTGSIWLGLLVSICSAVVIGIINGYLVSRFHIQPMIVTMAMMYILRSVSKAVTECAVVRFGNSQIKSFVSMKLFGVIPVQFFVAFMATLAVYLIVRKSKLGIYLEACGNNLNAAKTAGIRTVACIVAAYIIGNVFTCLGGIYDASVVSSVDPTKLGLEFEFRAIAAVVIGGTPIAGGRPNVIGSVFGVIILKLISMMIQMNNITSEWSYVVTALIIIAAILMQNVSKIRGKE